MKQNHLMATVKPTILFFLLSGSAINAQTQDSLKTDQSLKDAYIDKVVITAGRKMEHINQIPSSVTVISQKEIQEQLTFTTDLSQIIGDLVPGLSVSNNKSNNSGQTLRGRTVLVLVDGIPQSTPLMNGSRDIKTLDPSVIERIEVIKGATSIYGNGAGGGIINYITKKNFSTNPVAGLTSVGLSGNPYHTSGTLGYRASQFLSGQLQKFSYMIGGSLDYTGLQRDSDGVVLGQTDGTSNSHQNNVYAKLNYDINEASTISLMYNFYNSTQRAKYISKIGVFGESPTIGVSGEDPGEDTGTPFNHNFILKYSNDNIFGKTQFDGSIYLNSFQSMNRYVVSTKSWYGPGQTQINSNKKGLRLNFNTPFIVGNKRGEVTYGLDILNDITYQDLTDGRVYVPKMNMSSIAPYTQIKIDLAPDLILKGGVRYEIAEVKVKNFKTLAKAADGSGAIDVQGGSFPYRGATFNAGLRYAKYKIFNPFISFTQGFSVNELGRLVRSAKESTLTNANTKPVLTNNYEAGFSSRYNIFSLTAAYFVSSSKDGVNVIEDSDGILKPQRAPENTRGFEITLDANISPMWKSGATYAYVEGEAENADGTRKNLSSSRIAPPKATAFIRYTPNSKLNLVMNWLMTGNRDLFERNTNGLYAAGEAPVKTVNLFNLAANYQLNQNWGMSLGFDNIFNQNYYTVASQYSANAANYVKGVGSTATFMVNYKF